MNISWLYGIGIVAAGLFSLVFIIRLDFPNALIGMIALFALTNSARARQFRGQGAVREARWMQGLSILFTVALAVVLILRMI
ncbi:MULTISPECIES: hypothetical protein [Sporosarcina]|uniref:hypothetical protein n=1 Tax=Sporosarcina TaxID=1569 RepID=UPI000590FDF8|nr:MULTISPECIES: hypothetical protein [Sporosarcina]WJY27157.1 hypothetical protein QWT68_14085 [Sporosarcina sp. 0.2-SM1T-5]